MDLLTLLTYNDIISEVMCIIGRERGSFRSFWNNKLHFTSQSEMD